MLRLGRSTIVAAGGAALALLAGASALAQTMDSNSASFNAGWGRMPDQENRPAQFDTRDANGNRVIINGVLNDSTGFASGAATASAGAGFGGATAIGNSLSVITQGNYNTVIVDSTQINNGTVIANANQNQTGGSGGNGS